MKGILEFDLPEERQEFYAAQKGSHYKMLIDTLYDEVFRPHLKYEKPIIGDELLPLELQVIEKIWEQVKEHIDEEL